MLSIQFSNRGKGSFVLGTALVLALGGCVGYAGRSGRGNVYASGGVQIEQEDYVYYPGYQMYYGSRTHQYYYQEGTSWVARSSPRGISANVLLAAPSVAMDFHDRPAAHHAQVVQAYPKTWVRSGGKGEHKADQRKDSRDANRR
jgi:hypothetical protein